MLAKVERGTLGPKGVIFQAGKQFMAYLKDIHLDKTRAQEAQRIATLPEKELTAAFAKAADDGSMLSIARLVKLA